MTKEEINNRLNDLKNEDFIWIVYLGIIFLSYYSNSIERKFLICNDLESKEKYRKIIILIFTILIVVYLYFLKSSYDSVKNLKPTDSPHKRKLVILSFWGSFLIALSGVIFLYIALADEDLNVELAFN